MAPFYALAISFVLVLLLGLTLPGKGSDEPDRKDTPTTQEPGTGEKPALPTGIEFSKRQPFPAKSLIVVWGDTKKVVTPEELAGLRPDEPVMVCAQMAKGWAAPEANITPENNVVCWGPIEPEDGKPIVLEVTRK
jgi:hypothetical protein